MYLNRMISVVFRYHAQIIISYLLTKTLGLPKSSLKFNISCYKLTLKRLPSIRRFANSEPIHPLFKFSSNSPNQSPNLKTYKPYPSYTFQTTNKQNKSTHIISLFSHDQFKNNRVWVRNLHLGRLEFLLGAVESADPAPAALDDGVPEFITWQ